MPIRPCGTNYAPKSVTMKSNGYSHKKIVVVEDEPHTRLVLQVLLKRAGYKVESATNGKEALSILEDKDQPVKPGLLLTDLKMPEMSGIELIEKLQEKKIQIPIIVFTGHGDKHILRKITEYKCADFLEKPFREDELLEKIRKVF